ncbi:MAG: protein kinase [Blastocatellia bacterium]
MENNRWREIERLFDETLELPEADRAAFLAHACCGDESLQREVYSLLAAHEQANGFLASHAAPLPAKQILQRPAASTTERIGPYQLLRELAQGGMGSVWLAQRADEQYHQQVAIKLLKTGTNNPDIAGRLRHERQILADLNHPNIARLLDGGMTESGQPYLVMEYIEGVPMDVYCQQQQLALRARLQLFRQVCAAVGYAHQHLIIHRDLKPANILVTSDGIPKLLDFGIAKLLQPGRSESYQTQTGQTPMTPAYASPEQVRSETLTTTSDVYSLGVVLYELLTGRSPYQLKANTYNEIIRAITEQEPERPSARDTATQRQSDGATKEQSNSPHLSIPLSLRPSFSASQLRGDLDAIVLMALRKEPGARYSSVEQFSTDIQRYLDGLPTLARKGTLSYRAVKYVRRHKVPVAATALILLSLLSGIGATSRQAQIARAEQAKAEAQRSRAEQAFAAADAQRRRAEEALAEVKAQRMRAENALTTAEQRRQQAEAARAETNRQRATAETQRLAAEAERNVAQTQRQRAETQEMANRRLLYASQIKLAQTAWDEGDFARVQELLQAHQPEAGKPDLRGFEWFWLQQISSAEITKLPHSAGLSAATFSPDGTRLVTIEADNKRETLRIWNSSNWELQQQITGQTERDIGIHAAFSSSGRIFATAGGDSCGISLWDSTTGKRVKRIAAADCSFRGLAFSRDGKTLASGHLNGQIIFFDADSGTETLRISAHPKWVSRIAFSPDGQRLVSTCAFENTIKLWDAHTGKELQVFNKTITAGMSPVFSPDGRSLIFCFADGELSRLDLRTGDKTLLLKINNGLTNIMEFSPDGKLFAFATTDRQVNFWDAQTWQPLRNLKGFGAPIRALAFSPDGQRLITGDLNYQVQLWDLQQSREPATYQLHKTNVDKMVFADGGKRLYVVGFDLVTRAFDMVTGRELYSLQGHHLEKPYVTPTNLMQTLAISSDGKTIATTGDESIKLWNAVTGQEIQNITTLDRKHYVLALSPDGRMVATNACPCGINSDPTKRDRAEHLGIWDTLTGKQLLDIRTTDVSINRILFLQNRQTLVTVGISGKGQLTWWDLATGKVIRTLDTLISGGGALALSPDGKTLAASAGNGAIHLFDALTTSHRFAERTYNPRTRGELLTRWQ